MSYKRKFLNHLIIAFIFSILMSVTVKSQSVSVSYFFPKDGYFANPIAPINFSLPLKFNNFFQITPGIGMANIGGMSMSGFGDGYNSSRPLIGPFQSFETSLIPTIVIPTKNVKVDLLAGVFCFFSFNNKIIYGNFNNMIAEKYNYKAVHSDFSIDKSAVGWGYLFGSKINIKVTKKQWFFVGVNYYLGKQKMNFSGNIIGIDSEDKISNIERNYQDVNLLYEGLSISLGVVL
jgi:hypothetical protein